MAATYPPSNGGKPAASDNYLEHLRALEPLVEFVAPAAEDDIASVEHRLGARVPDELRAFLLASDGATTGVDLGSGGIVRYASKLVWSIAEIDQSLRAEAIVPRPSNVMFFANAGVDGILFGHAIHQSGQVGDEVVWWNPIENDLTPAASSFRSWLES